MTILQKALIAATVLILAGVAFYETRQVAHLRAQLRTVQQAQAPLSAQIQQLQSEQSDATNRLAGMREQNERLNEQLSRTKPELLRLRSQLTLANNELTQLQASTTKIAATAEQARSAMADLQILDERLLAHVNATRKAEDKVEHLIKEMKIPEETVSAAYDAINSARPIPDNNREFFQAVRELDNKKVFFWILVRRIEQEKEKAAQEAAK